ncbi:hypothetical protein ACFVJ5_30755 [Nocardia sp. NPDC127606]|uniref:hypothetical protein n=1 Tax=Nocardia sp. NPDC127606 TaxID=3345406 RepID=UPI003644F166
MPSGDWRLHRRKLSGDFQLTNVGIDEANNVRVDPSKIACSHEHLPNGQTVLRDDYVVFRLARANGNSVPSKLYLTWNGRNEPYEIEVPSRKRPAVLVKWSEEAIVRIAASVATLGAAGIAVLVATGSITSATAGFVAMAGLAAIVFGITALSPRIIKWDLFRHVKSVSVGPAALEMFERASLSASLTSEDTTEQSQTLYDLKLRLEAKLTYVAKHVLAPNPYEPGNVPTFLTIGSLKADEYLTDEQARLAYEILELRESEFRNLTADRREIILAGANKFVGNVRAEIFTSQVLKGFVAQGWNTTRRAYPDISGNRDLRVGATDTEVVHQVIPIFTASMKSGLARRAAAGVDKRSKARGKGKVLIVVPPLSKAKGTVIESGQLEIQVVTLEVALSQLGKP